MAFSPPLFATGGCGIAKCQANQQQTNFVAFPADIFSSLSLMLQ